MRIAFVSGFALCLGIVGNALETQLPRSDAKLSLDDHTSRVDVVGFSTDGTMAVTGSGSTITVWDARTGKWQYKVRAPRGGINSVLFLPDNQRVVAGGRDKPVRIWTIDTSKPEAEIPIAMGQDDGVIRLAMTKDGNLLAAATYSNAIHLIDLKTNKTIEALKGHKDGPNIRTNSLAFSPDGKYLASASTLDATVIWDVQKRKVLHRLVGDRATGMDCAAWSPDGKTLATSGPSSNIILWDAASGDFIKRIDPGGRPSGLAFSPKEDLLAITHDGNPRVIFFWDIATNQSIATYQGHQGNFTSLAFSPDGRLLITGSDDKTAKIWQVPSK